MDNCVLVVEDDPAAREMLGEWLLVEGFTPVMAANGADALDYLRRGGEASVILLDLMMPVMDGWAFRREQRSDPALAAIPVVVVSALDPAAQHSELSPAASFRKPLDIERVISVVRDLCRVD